MSYELHCGDCLEVMPTLPANSVDSIVCDPPYGLSFMNRNWDHGVPGVPFWEAALRVAKPGAMLLAFGGTRTHHRLMVAIEDAGWEIRDCLMWLYGQGFPKSMDISKAIDKAAGVERERIRGVRSGVVSSTYAQDKWSIEHKDSVLSPEPITDAAKQWQGYGTALKPAWEPIILAMKPLDGTFANNALEYGVGGLNVDGCRIGVDSRPLIVCKPKNGDYSGVFREGSSNGGDTSIGRWPANVLLDEEAAALLDEQSGERRSSCHANRSDSKGGVAGFASGKGYAIPGENTYSDTGGASRFFYVAKASASERNSGLQDRAAKKVNDGRQTPIDNPFQRGETERLNTHPTVKPIELMRYLCRLTKTPFGGTVLDPFMGSGSTGCAAVLEGRSFIGIDNLPEYVAIAQKRLQDAAAQPLLISLEA